MHAKKTGDFYKHLNEKRLHECKILQANLNYNLGCRIET